MFIFTVPASLVVSMLASGIWVRRFKPGRSRWIFQGSEKSSACLPSKGKWKTLSHVPALWHVKEPSTSTNYVVLAKFPCIVPSFASRGLSCICGAWRWMRGTHWGQGYNRPTSYSAEKAPHATFNIFNSALWQCGNLSLKYNDTSANEWIWKRSFFLLG